MLEQASQFSFSRLNVLSTCRMKYYYKYIEHKERLEPIPDYIHVGKIIDAALLAAQNKSDEIFTNLIARNNIKFVDEKWKYFCYGFWNNRQIIYDKIFGQIEDIILQYPIQTILFNTCDGEIISNDKGDEIPITGQLDGWSKMLNTIYEVKTTGSSIDQTFIEHIFMGQTQIYTHTMIEKLNLTEIPHVVYIYIKKPRIRQKKNESLEEFNQRMFEAGQDPEIVPRQIDYTQEEIAETMAYYYDRVYKDLHAEPVQDRNGCYKFGNRCEYYNYCWQHQHNFEEEQQEENAA